MKKIALTLFCVFGVVALVFFNVSKNGEVSSPQNSESKPTPFPTKSMIFTGEEQYKALLKTLPQFSGYPISESSAKPRLDIKSHWAGMHWRSLLTDWVHNWQKYDFAGSYLTMKPGTGNPNVLMVHGPTGKVFYEYGGMGEYVASVSSSLVIFDPFFIPDAAGNDGCFSKNGDYSPCYGSIGGIPRYAIWDGKRFKTICEPVVRNWKVISCGGPLNYTQDFFERATKEAIGGTVISSDLECIKLKVDKEYSDVPYPVIFACQQDAIAPPLGAAEGDTIQLIGYIDPTEHRDGLPLLRIDAPVGFHNPVIRYSK